jgi:hypothetical protein
MEGSGSVKINYGSRSRSHKNIWIRNTAKNRSVLNTIFPNLSAGETHEVPTGERHKPENFCPVCPQEEIDFSL